MTVEEITKVVMKGSEYFRLAVLLLVLGVICIMGPISAILYFAEEGSNMTPAEQLGDLSYVIWPILGIGVLSIISSIVVFLFGLYFQNKKKEKNQN